MISIKICKSKSEALTMASSELTQILFQFTQTKTPILFLVSGGSALEILDSINPTSLSPVITVSVLDERFSSDPTINNFSQFMQTKLYTDAKKSGCTFIDTRLNPNETQANLKKRFESVLRTWKQNYPHGKIIITQGIGSDGHTSGIFPFPENPKKFTDFFMNPNTWVASYDATGKNPYPLRVSTTLTFLKTVDNSILFVCGDDKKPALLKTLSPDGTFTETPARIINSMKDVYLYTDQSIS
jgi:6-phosphogluconolactonase/glucosamine-6-phosphate isomerase/deaminase